MPRTDNETAICRNCGVVFAYYRRPSLPHREFCSTLCANSARMKANIGENNHRYAGRVELRCEVCGAPFSVTPRLATVRRRCSRPCDAAARANAVEEYRIDPTTGCWDWQRYTDAKGYARISVDGKRRLAHRISYERHIGAIPAGLEIDHTCHNTSCVNPAHLEPVTQDEHRRRHASGKAGHP